MALETELKLLLEEGQRVRAIDLSRSLGVAVSRRAKRYHLISTYFDTPASDLADRGMALRIRRIGKVRIQGLKVATKGAAGLANFLEFETPIKGDAPDLSLIGDVDVREKLLRAGFWDQLRPLFRTEFDRASWLIPFRQSSIEFSWDHGRIQAGRRSEPINELELELKDGTPEDLFGAAEALLESLPYRISTRTKAARGMALVRGDLPKPTKSLPAPLSRKDDVGAAFEKIVKSCLDQMSANEVAVLDSADPEAIHQLRVALRRFRAILGPFRELIDDAAHAVWAIDLRWAQRQFGPARDLDVFVVETARPMLRHLGWDTSLVQLLAAAEAAREEARRRALQALNNPRYASMQLQILACLANGRWRHPAKQIELAQPITSLAERLLHMHHKRVRRLGKNWQELSDSDLHRLRILVKKLRYLVGFFQPIYEGRRARAYAEALAQIQDCLGAVNDAVMGRQILREIVPSGRDSETSPETEALQRERAAGLVTGWQVRGIEAQRNFLQELWPKFVAARRFWRRPNE